MLNPQFPNYANSAAGTEVIGWTIVGGQPLYRLPVAYVDTGFGAAFVCEGSTIEAPTYPEGVYDPDPVWESAGVITGTPQVGQTLTFTPGTASGTAPITETYNWIRYIPGGQSVIVGSGLNYSPVTADLTHTLIVQSVATNSLGSVATQTVPFGPIVPSAPVITSAGSITSVPPNPAPSGGGVASINVVNGGANYFAVLGATRLVDITGDGSGASATANLSPTGSVVAVPGPYAGQATPGSSGTITYSGTNGETPFVLNWGTPGDPGVIDITIANGGAGWTQQRATDAANGTYGTRVVTNESDWIVGPSIAPYVGCSIASITVNSAGINYTTAAATVIEDANEVGFPTPATLLPVLGGGGPSGPIIYPTQTAVFSGPTVTGNSPQVSWVWGYGSGSDFTPIQLGGTTFSPVPVSAVGKEIFVKVTATNLGGTVTAFSTGITVEGAAPTIATQPKIGPQLVEVGDTVTGQQGSFTGYPTPQVIDWGFAEFLLPTPSPIVAANKRYRYTLTPAELGKQICFYVTAQNSVGTTTAYSNPTDEVYDTLQPVSLPQLTGYQSPAQVGDVLTATPGTFSPPSSYQYSYFAYLNPDKTVTEISGTRNTTSYTLSVGDTGKEIVYASYGEIIGRGGFPETLTTKSPSTGRITQLLNTLTPPTVTWVGPAPQLGNPITSNIGTTYPTYLSQSGGPKTTSYTLWVVNDDGTYNSFVFRSGLTTFTTDTTVLPEFALGKRLRAEWVVNYRDANNTGAIQTASIWSDFTPPAQGVAPAINPDPQFSSSNIYNPGYTLTFVPGTVTGKPLPTNTWEWERQVSGGWVTVQTKGLTYVLPDDSAGWVVRVSQTAASALGTLTKITDPQLVGGPVPVWTRLPVITGNPLMTPTQGTTLNGITPLARDPITDTPLPVTWQWMAQYPGQTPTPLGNPSTTFNFINENGKWTGADIYIQGSATNAIGTVTCESNRITLIGTPRILGAGEIYTSGFGLAWRLNVNVCTYDGGGQTTTSDWTIFATIGSQTSGFGAPATSSPLTGLLPGNGTANGSQTITNSQGTTNYNFPQTSIQKI